MNNKKIIKDFDKNQFLNKIEDSFIPKKIKEIAIKTNTDDKRKKLIHTYNFAMIMLLSNTLSNNITLRRIIDLGKETKLIDGYDVTPSALSQQVSKRASFFQEMYKQLVILALNQNRKTRKRIFKLFKQINIFDSSTIPLCIKLLTDFSGKAGKSALKIHVNINKKLNIPEDIKISDARTHDRKVMPVEDKITPNSLYIFDLGYCDHNLYKKIHNKNSFFVVRAKINTSCKIIESLDKKHKDWIGKRIDSLKNATEFDEEYDLIVELKNGYQLRMVKVYSVEESKYYRYFTNLFDTEAWSISDIKDLYTLRWTIEIFFRDLKHVLGCIKIIFTKKENVMSQIYCALCYYLIVRLFMILSCNNSNNEIEDLSFKYCSDLVQCEVKQMFVNNNIISSNMIRKLIKNILKEINKRCKKINTKSVLNRKNKLT